ncbi:egl nine homolog 1-like [Dendronephthya gigantea]|uniref:egl nine homolog 1-like n=1 Tax=Dendronephthya gigantea TaxID=151771 RepID=UPI00106D4198|nr:egl nine homolog 1-like [Dendronephthya gigantea]
MSKLAKETLCIDCRRLELPRRCDACKMLKQALTINTYVNSNVMSQPDTRSNTLEELARNVLDKLNHQGYCVIDKFHKEQTALAILDEVKRVHEKGRMHNGQLTTNTLTSENIRGDLIVWLDGREPENENILLHMRRVDALVRELNKMISYHKIEGRTQAMVACYPGGGKRYRKHVDNPNQDGRCLTTLYYLNKDYDREVCGGILRLYPHGGNMYVDIEPILDRLFIFWSDRRNPHEVLPAHTVRYAITLWYFDKEEREAEYQRLENLKMRGSQAQRT